VSDLNPVDVRGPRRYLRPIDRIELRQAGADDASTVAALHADSWRRHYRGAYSDAFLDGDVEADRKVVWSGRLVDQDGGTSTILAEENGEPVGFVHVVFDDDPAWGALVDNLHVIHRRKRSGIGTRLMAAAAAAVVGRGRGGLYLWVLEQNVAAQAFYDARGGRPADRREVNPPGGVPGRLKGTPRALRYVWPDPAVLVDARSGT
jgi:GNAT superfamily N-acetyltransferase